MRTPIAGWLFGLVSIGFGAACGGLVGGEPGHGGSEQDAAVSSSGGPRGGSSGGGSSGGGSSGVASSGGGFSGSSGGFSGSSGGAPDGSYVGPGGDFDGNCSTSILTASTSGSFGACWSCVAKGCAAPLMACAEDCQCNAAIAAALDCAGAGGDPVPCFSPVVTGGNGDSAQAMVGQCLLSAGADCSCLSAAPSSTDGGCVQTGGGSSGGNGQCTSDLSETCGSESYQVVCVCPQGSCACFGPSSTTTMTFAGCPYCPAQGIGTVTSDDLYTQCGFPH